MTLKRFINLNVLDLFIYAIILNISFEELTNLI